MAWDDDAVTRPGQPLPSPSDILSGILGRARNGYEPDAGDDGQTPAKKSDPLPRPGDPYRAHARFLNRLHADTRMIHFVRGDFTCEGFRYSDLRRLRWLPSNDPGSGPVLVLRFAEAEITDVTIEGRRLEDVHHWIGEGAMPWVWEQPAGFKVRDDAATVITRITVSEAKQRMSGEG